jgi:pimeloyl-ACP methyl ester carboxylesterase
MLEIKNLILQLDNGEEIKCAVAGTGKNLCYIIGPGSFYLKGLAFLAEYFTFITCDGLWARSKESSSNEDQIALLTVESLLEREFLVIKKICQNFDCEKIGIMGFSAPGVLMLKYALHYPNTLAWMIGTGLALCPVDLNFSFSNEIFNLNAKQEKKKRFDDSYKNYQNIQNDDNSAIPMITTHFFVDDKKKRRMTPNSDYLEQVRFLIPKLLYDESYSKECFEHWQNNLSREVLDPAMREHFFSKIQPNLPTLDLLKSLALNEDIPPFLLISGENDFITPPVIEMVEYLSAKFTIKLYPDCGHMPYIEQKELYLQDVLHLISSITNQTSFPNKVETEYAFPLYK